MVSDQKGLLEGAGWCVAACADDWRLTSPEVGKGANDGANRILPGVANDSRADGEPIRVIEWARARGVAHACSYAVRFTVPFFWYTMAPAIAPR